VDLGGTVIGTVDVVKGDSGKDAKDDANPVTSAGSLNRVRIDGGGEAGDGQYSGYFRYSEGGFAGYAAWKPVDAFKLLIGSNGYDGFIGKEGVTGWGFHQTATDNGVTFGGAGVWADTIYWPTPENYPKDQYNPLKISYRNAFFEGGGDGGNALYLFINPIDILGINIILPVFNNGKTEDIFKKIVAQVDLKFDFGNIALTYMGGLGTADGKAATGTPGTDTKGASTILGPTYKDASGNDKQDEYYWNGSAWAPVLVGTPGDPEVKEIDDPASIFVYYGGSFGDLSIDFGLGYKMAGQMGGESYNNPINVGLGVKYATDAFGIKFRTLVSLPGEDWQSMAVLAEILPFIPLGDNLTAYINFGIGMLMPPKDHDDGDTIIGWHFNPYIIVGEEWGAKFLAGVKLWSGGDMDVDKQGNKGVIHWAIPIAVSVSF